MSNNIPIAQNYNFVFHDVNNCANLTVSGVPNCNCTSDAGSMGQSTVTACISGNLQVNPATGFFLDGDDSLRYILHTNPGLPVGTILAWSATPDFTFLASMDAGTTYYVSSVAVISAQRPDRSNRSLFINIHRNTGNIPAGTDSRAGHIRPRNFSGDSVMLQVNFTGAGPFSFVPLINGVAQPAINNILGNSYSWVFKPTVNTVLTLSSVSDQNCPAGTVTGTATIGLLSAPVAGNIQTSCDNVNGTYVLTFDVSTGVEPFSITGNPGNFIGTTFTSDPIPFGTAYDIILTDDSNCGSDTISGTSACACHDRCRNHERQYPAGILPGQQRHGPP